MQHRLAHAATRDIARLYRQSIIGFGPPRANNYLAGLEEMFAKIAVLPESSPERDEYVGRIRIRRFAAHHVLYRIDPSEIVILRVLHGRQDTGRYL